MCELMGMSFAKPVMASFSIQAFGERSLENADGWGLAWYPDRSLAMVKQPVRWSVQHTQFLEHYPGLLSATYVAHVRHRTTGAIPTHADTHPFCRELNGRDYCFAHNGTLAGQFWDRPLGRFRPIGGTDSEYLFCLLLAELESFADLAKEVAAEAPDPERVGIQLGAEKRWSWLHRFLARLNDFGRLNCMLSDGERLVVYHDKNGWKGMTHCNIFMHQDAVKTFADTTVAIDLQAQPVNHGVIVATNPLSLEGWTPFVPGEMKVLHAGAIEFTARLGLHEHPAPANGKAEAKPPASPVLTGEAGKSQAL